MNKKSAISSFTAVASLTVLSSLLLLIASLLPPLGIPFYFFLKAPIILISLTRGIRIGLLAVGVSAALAIPLSRWDYSLPYLLEYGVVSLLMAQALRFKISFARTVVICAAASVSIALVALAVKPPMGAASLFEVPSRLVSEMKGDVEQLVAQGKMDAAHLKGVGYFITLMDAIISRAFPALLIVGAAAGALFNYLAAKRLSRGFQGSGGLNPVSLVRWAAPENCIWFFIVGGLMAILPFSIGKTLGLNLLIVILFVYFLQGLAITSFFFQKWNVSAFFKVPIYLFIFFNVFLSVLVACVGLFDLWADFRKLKKAPGTT